MNKKGVTLVELIIVIVIIGIISAFAVPAVGRYLENAQKSAVLRDAQELRSAVNSYCIETSCADNQVYVWTGEEGTEIGIDDLGLVDNFDAANYAGGITATWDGTDWTIELDSTVDGAWEYVSATDPINATVADVTADPAN